MFARLFLLFNCIVLVNAAQYTVTHSDVKEVSIGGSIAEVSRSFSLDNVPKGFHTIIVNHVPPTVDEKSIQVAGTGAAEVVSTMLHKQVVFREDDAKYAELMAKLEATQKFFHGETQTLNLEKKRINQRIDSWNSYAQNVLKPDAVTKTISMTLDQMSEMLNFEEKMLGEQNGKLVEIDAKLASVQKTSTTLQQMIEGLRSGFQYRNLFIVGGEALPVPSEHAKVLSDLPKENSRWPAKQNTREIHINIHVPTETSGGNKLDFAFEYMTSPARWVAEYDMRLQSPSTSSSTTSSTATTTASASAQADYELRIGLYAVVSQETQEDWRDVMLHLSTGQPQPNIYSPAPPARLSIAYQPEYQPPPQQVRHKSAARTFARSSGMHPEMMAADMGGVENGLDGIFMAAGAPVEMSVAGVGMAGSGGNMGAAVTFSPKYPVNITSNYREVSDTATRSTRLFIKEMAVTPSLFTYIVPTAESGAFLKAWTSGGAPAEDAMPLLESPTGRVFIDDTYTGTTSVPSTQPGASLRLELGQDRNIEVKSTYVLPRKGSQTQDKSTWFVTDKVKYKVEVAEWAFTVRSTHAAPHLVVLSEYLPHAAEEGIKVELLQPAPDSALKVKPQQLGDSEEQDVWNEQDFVAAVLAHPALKKPDATQATANNNKASDMQVFYSKGSNNLVWAQWVLPGQTLKAGLKYRIIYPDGKNINKVHY